MATTYGYTLAVDGSGVQAQAEAIRLFVRGGRPGPLHPPGHPDVEVFVETGARWLPLPRRPGGLRLGLALCAGDLVVCPTLDVFANLADLVAQLSRWSPPSEEALRCAAAPLRVAANPPAGVRLVVLDPPLDTGTPEGQRTVAVLTALLAAERAGLSAKAHAQVAAQRARGLSWGNPPYGFKWGGVKGKRRHVPDPATRALGARIVDWHDRQNFSFEQIAIHLIRCRVKTRRGGDHSKSTVHEMYRGELLLRAKEKDHGN